MMCRKRHMICMATDLEVVHMKVCMLVNYGIAITVVRYIVRWNEAWKPEWGLEHIAVMRSRKYRRNNAMNRYARNPIGRHRCLVAER